ncbi:MAG: tellurite resistance TerB family protein [Rhodospirillaceae bacterium]|nr:tellurite resistance TerB family protein [Rhodospirillaceae bacterium]
MNSPAESLICALIMVSAADRKMGDAELRRIGRYVKTLPAFGGFDPELLTDVARKVAAILADENGLENGLAFVRNGLPPRLRETAYVLACELAMADRSLPLEERRILQLLRQHLEIDRLVAAAIERSTLARFAEPPAEAATGWLPASTRSAAP